MEYVPGFRGPKMCTIQDIVYFFVPFLILYYIQSLIRIAAQEGGRTFYTGQAKRGLPVNLLCGIKAVNHLFRQGILRLT